MRRMIPQKQIDKVEALNQMVTVTPGTQQEIAIQINSEDSNQNPVESVLTVGKGPDHESPFSTTPWQIKMNGITIGQCIQIYINFQLYDGHDEPFKGITPVGMVQEIQMPDYRGEYGLQAPGETSMWQQHRVIYQQSDDTRVAINDFAPTAIEIMDDDGNTIVNSNVYLYIGYRNGSGNNTYEWDNDAGKYVITGQYTEIGTSSIPMYIGLVQKDIKTIVDFNEY